MTARNGNYLPRWRVILDGLASLSLVVVCLTIAWAVVYRGSVFGTPTTKTSAVAPNIQRPPQQLLPKEPVSIVDSATKGASDAKVAIIEFTDFECPYCAQFSRTTLKEIERDYIDTGKVLLAVKHLPIESIHRRAMPAAIAAECARRENRFWEMHDRLFESPAALADAAIEEQAQSLSLGETFQRCLESEGERAVRADAANAEALGVRGTPGFLIGRVQPDGRIQILSRLSGAVPFDRFKAEIERVLGIGS